MHLVVLIGRYQCPEAKEEISPLRALLQEHTQAPLGLRDTMCKADSIGCLADGFKALADATRLHLMYLLMTRGEMCVCEFMPLLGLTQSNVSFHLKTLRHARFITSRKEGKWVYYSLNREAVEQFRTDFGSVFDLGKWPEKTANVHLVSSRCTDRRR